MLDNNPLPAFAQWLRRERSLVEAAGIEPIFRFLNGKLTAALMKGEVVLALRLHITTGFFLIL